MIGVSATSRSRFPGTDVALPSELRAALDGALERRLQVAVDRVVGAMALARDRALAHAVDPAKYPLPAGRSTPEQVFHQRVRRLGKEELRAKSRVGLRRIESTGQQRARAYGELAGVSVRTTAGVTEQLRAAKLPSPFSAADLRQLSSARLAPRATATPASRLELELGELRCVKKTRNFGELDSKDEILLSASASAVNLPAASRELSMGKFGKGDSRPIEPSPFFAFDLGNVSFPVAAALQFELIEKDRGTRSPAPAAEIDAGELLQGSGLGAEFGLKVGLPVIITVANVATAMSGGVFAPAAAGVAFVCACLAIANGITLLSRAIAALQEDDHYPVVEAPPLLLTSASDRPSLIGQEQNASFVATSQDSGFQGQYQLTYVWRLR
jgi:hypothetical protein